jgi:small subunit ribosomal protein S2
MRNYIYQKGKKNYFLDWQKIITSCKKVGNYIKKLGDKKTILFLTTQKQGGEIVKEQAQKCGMPYIVNK